MCDFISGYQYPDGSLHFHADDDVEAAWERKGRTEPISWCDMVGHSAYRFCFGDPPAGSQAVEGLHYAVAVDLRRFAKLARGAGYKSIALNDAVYVAEGDKLREEGRKLIAQGRKLWREGQKLYAQSYKLWREGHKLIAQGRKLRREGDRLCREGDNLRAEGNKLVVRIER